MLTLDECISKLAQFKAESASKYGIARIGVFGSVARGEQTEHSDVDIVVVMDAPRLEAMHELYTQLKGLFGRPVDVVRYRSSLDSSLMQDIERDARYV